MRLLCTGDLHLGASPDLGARPSDRLRDQETVWRRVLELSGEQEVDAILFAGDAFHRRRPTPEELMAFERPLLDVRGLPVIAIAGNHDVEHAERATGLEVLGDAGLITTSRLPQTFELFPGQVTVATLPWTPSSRLVAARSGGDRDEVAADVADLLVDSARELRAQIPSGARAILMAHWSVSGAALPTGMPTDVLREPVLPLAELLTLGYDAIVLGHIHKPQLISPGRLIENGNGSHVVDSPCPVFYVGSPAVVDWGETGFRHGVWILDTDEMQVSFHPVEDRPFVTVDLDLTDTTLIQGEDETDALAAALAEHLPLSDALIRLRYTATAEQARRIGVEALRGFCADAGAAKLIVRPEILREDRVRVAGVDESMSELDALDLYIEHNFAAIPSPRAAELRDLTTTYLEAA